MRVLAVNCGSSSLKAQLIDATTDGERSLARVVVERIGHDVPDHAAALTVVLTRLRAQGHGSPEAVGHRIVHGGARYTAPTRIDENVIAALSALEELAPLHNAPG